MTWWLKNTADIHYHQDRPMPLAKAKAHSLPLTTDCSGAVTCIYFTAGAPDPNDLGYNGQGFTGTLLNGGEAIGFAELECGDCIVCSEGDKTVHVYMVYKGKGNAATLFSHGEEKAPETLTLAAAIASRGKGNLHPVRFIPASSEVVQPVDKPVWVVLNGRGERIGKTEHPAQWAGDHSADFRTFNQVRFMQR
jgi:hypothetical protein